MSDGTIGGEIIIAARGGLLMCFSMWSRARRRAFFAFMVSVIFASTVVVAVPALAGGLTLAVDRWDLNQSTGVVSGGLTLTATGVNATSAGTVQHVLHVAHRGLVPRRDCRGERSSSSVRRAVQGQ